MAEDTGGAVASEEAPGMRGVEEIVACTAMVVVVLATAWGVFTRYVSAQPATWTAEIAATGFCWAIFFGSAAAFRRGQHVSIDMLTGLFPDAARRVATGLADLLTLAFLGWVCGLAVTFAIDSWDTPMPSLRWPYTIHYAGAALGLGAMTLRHAIAARGRLSAARGG